jgi:hypothetical protein
MLERHPTIQPWPAGLGKRAHAIGHGVSVFINALI